MKLKTQVGYELKVHHNGTVKGAFLWWLLRKNVHCKSFCPLCEFYYLCQETVAFENLMK